MCHSGMQQGCILGFVTEVEFSAQCHQRLSVHAWQPQAIRGSRDIALHEEMRFTSRNVQKNEDHSMACISTHVDAHETFIAVNFVASLKACAKDKDLEKGSQLHTDIMKSGVLENNVFVGSALVNMYAKCGALERAQEVFDLLPVRNVVSWNALIAGYTQHELGHEALECFNQMQQDNILPTGVTFSSILRACTNIGALDKGRVIHAQILREGMLEKHVSAANALVDMYAKCGALEKAREVFDGLLIRDEVSWNALITGYTQQGLSKEALDIFEQMQLEGLSSNAVTFSCILKACGNIGAIDKGQEIHNHIEREHLLKSDIVLGNALVDMYAKCGALEKARRVFNNLPSRNVVSWTVLISGYAQHGHGEEALNCFEEMQSTHLSPDVFTLASILKACGSIGASEKGQRFHSQSLRGLLMESQLVIGSALIDMYAKCGELKKAHKLFDEFKERSIVSWNALMAGYAQLGNDEIVLDLLQKMTREGIKPCSVTLIIVLNTCSHRGLLDKGEKYFENIGKGYGITPTLEHHTCIIDLFSRAGRFDKAIAVVEKVPLYADLPMWLTLLDACQKWGNVNIANWAFKQAIKSDDSHVSAHICMSNICAAAVN